MTCTRRYNSFGRVFLGLCTEVQPPPASNEVCAILFRHAKNQLPGGGQVFNPIAVVGS